MPFLFGQVFTQPPLHNIYILHRAWVGDVVMVITKKERGYLASLLDRYSRRCVGWAISAINDTALTLKALNRAIAVRQPEAGLIHHSDHGPCLHQWGIPGSPE